MNKEEIETGVSHIAYFRTDGGSPRLYTEEYVEEKDKEIERLNNIINELEKELEYEKNMYKENLDIETTDTVKEFLRGNAWLADDMLNRLKELKEGR